MESNSNPELYAVSDETMGEITKKYNEEGQVIAQREGKEGFLQEAMAFIEKYVLMMVGPDTYKDVTYKICETEANDLGMFLCSWDMLHMKAQEINKEFAEFEETIKPCLNYIMGCCDSDPCEYCHEGLDTIKDCGCCREDMLGTCPNGDKCELVHGCCSEKLKAYAYLSNALPSDLLDPEEAD